jgi:hypothetical protein
VRAVTGDRESYVSEERLVAEGLVLPPDERLGWIKQSAPNSAYAEAEMLLSMPRGRDAVIKAIEALKHQPSSPLAQAVLGLAHA